MYTPKDIIKKVKRQYTEQKKIFASLMFDNGLLSRMSEQLSNSTTIRKKKVTDMNKHFAKEETTKGTQAY